jgi:hypothetical protein
MLPFTTLMLRLSLSPIEFARAYCEAFASAAPNVPPKLYAPKLDPSNGGAVAAAKAMRSGSRVPPDQSSNSGKAMSTQFYDKQVATVNFQILFTKRDNEALLGSGRVIVTSAMAESGFASWRIALFIRELNFKQNGPAGPLTPADGIAIPVDWTDQQAIDLTLEVYPWNNYPNLPPAAPIQRVIGLKPENLKYLQVDHQIISTFDRKPPQDQIGALREIADAIKSKS